MTSENIFWARQLGPDCKVCAETPECSCNTQTEDCIRINRDCNTCGTFKCEPKTDALGSGSSSTSKAGASKGALAGAIVGIIIFLSLALGLFLWYRRKQRAAKSKEEGVKEVPAAAEDVLKRPDPSEKMQAPQSPTSNLRVYSSHSSTTIDLDPDSQNGSVQQSQQGSQRTSNPFTDTHSIQTAITEGTNVIPIALVRPDNSSSLPAPPGSPSRPARSPELNLDHANVSMDTLRTPDRQYADSQISGISGRDRRQSYQTNASFSSDFLYEAPMIVTGSSAVRQVLGVSKAEVISAPGSVNSGSDLLRAPSLARPTTSSPLAATSFGPADVVREVDEEQEIVVRNDPFGDEYSPLPSSRVAPPSTANTAATFATSVHPISRPVTQTVEWHDNPPVYTWSRSDDSSRPSSINTQAGSVIDIGSATRVNVGLAGRVVAPNGGNSRSPVRATMGKLVTPTTEQGTLEGQQQVAFINAHAFENDGGKRSSAASGVSVTADSILESFPFVPPSPISSRPARSPPASPLAKEAFQSSSKAQPPSPLEPPNTQVFGTAGSHLSTASSGLGSFDFQIDPEPATLPKATAPSSFKHGGNQGRQRASLDTLALTADLSSYPLGFENETIPKRA